MPVPTASPRPPVPCSRRHTLALLAAACLPARAQPRFPDRPITLVVPFGPGGIADLTARAVGEALARSLGQPVVVDNQPGAGAIVASQRVARAVPDGHTLLLLSNANAVAVSLMKPPGPDPLKDFAPVSTLGSFDLGLFAAVNGRFATLAAALDWARAHPGQLNIGSIAVGKSADLVLWSGDPLDVAHTARQVWMQGRAIPMRSRQTELRDRYLRPTPQPEQGQLPYAYPAR